jgi:hypothetical protein
MDHFTKYIWGTAFKGKAALPIALWLYNLFTTNITMPERWHADNGGEFKNYHMDAVREMLGSRCDEKGMMLEYSHSMPRNPRCQGLVERGNCTIKHSLHKLLTRDGFVDGEDETWEFRPYLKKLLFDLNRKVVSLYGFSPIVIMTGSPAEAPDHDRLNPEELRAMHDTCAENQKRQAQGLAAKSHVNTFEKGDVVLVAKVGKKSHRDLKGRGGMTFPGRAVVVRPSRTTENQYKICWLSVGLVGSETYGTISGRVFGAWRLKKVVTPLEQSLTYAQDLHVIARIMKTSIFAEVGTSRRQTIQQTHARSYTGKCICTKGHTHKSDSPKVHSPTRRRR